MSLYPRSGEIMRIRNPANGNSKGSILFTVILVLVFLAVLGMNLMTFLYSRMTVSMLELDRLKALYLAEAGIAKSIGELKSDIDYDGNGLGNIAKTKLGDGTFQARHNFQTATITGIGEVNKVKRIIQIKYSTL
jgi:Tfp pilus assembly protein PilX